MKKTLLISVILSLVLAGCGNVIEKAEKATFTIYTYDEFGTPLATGSGFFVESEGVGVTNYHVLDESVKAIIKVDEEKYEIDSVLCSSRKKDLLVFRVKNPDNVRFSTLKITNKKPAKGDKIIIVGSPLGLESTYSEGVVSSYRTDYHGEVVQTTASISPGSSGSPMMNERGEVFAVVSFKNKAGESLNFGIVVNENFKNDLDKKEFSKKNPKFNTDKSDLRILNIQSDEDVCLMLNAIEFTRSATTLYFTYINLNLDREMAMQIPTPTDSTGFYIEDKDTKIKYYATTSSLKEDSRACHTWGVDRFKVYLPAIDSDISTINIVRTEHKEATFIWKFTDVHLDEYSIFDVKDEVYYREFAIRALTKNGDIESTEELFNDLLEENPEDVIAMKALGALSYVTEDYMEALMYFTDAIEAQPQDPSLYWNRYCVYMQLRDYDNALKDINSAIERTPNGGALFTQRRFWIYYSAMNQYQKALADANKILEWFPNNSYWTYWRNQCRNR